MNKSTLKKILTWAPIVLAALAVIMIFLPAVVMKFGSDSANYSGLKVLFGYSESDGAGKTAKIFTFSFGALLPYLLVIAGGVLAFLGHKKNNKIMHYVSAGAFFLATILFFCMVNFVVFGSGALGGATGAAANLMIELFRDMMDLGAGPILSAIFSLLALGAVVVNALWDLIFPEAKAPAVEETPAVEE